MLKIGIVGLGDIAQVHIQAIDDNQEAQLVAVCDENELCSYLFTSLFTLISDNDLCRKRRSCASRKTTRN